MRPIHFVWGLLVLVILVVGGAATLVVLAVEARPMVAMKAEFTAQQIDRAQKLWAAHDVRTLKEGEVRTLEVSQADLNLGLGYWSSRSPGAGASAVLSDLSATVRVTVQLPNNPLGHYLNLKAVVVPSAGLPRVDSLQVGGASLPGFVGDWVLAEALRQIGAADVIQDLTWSASSLRLTYQWKGALARTVQEAVVPADEQARWEAYQSKLAEVTKALGAGRTVSLTRLMDPLFRMAADRSASGDPAAENRAAAVVLGSYLVNKGLDLLVPAARQWPQPVRLTVTLEGRDDFSKHFAISAAMAAAAGTSFADAVGLYKELKDSKGGSGFSFNDMAADRAGTRFGQRAIQARGGARRVQDLASAGFQEKDIFPDVSDLPEFLQEADFVARYGGVGKPEYNAMMEKINTRVEALPVLH